MWLCQVIMSCDYVRCRCHVKDGIKVSCHTEHYIGDEDKQGNLVWGLMAARVDLVPLPPFDPLTEPSSIAQRWKTWKRRFETYLVALNVTEDKQKRALLLYQAGQSTQEIFDTLPGTGEEDDYETAMTKLNEYFSPKKNVDYEIFQFRQAVQNAGETVDQFATRLRKLAAHCEFPSLDRELKSAIIQNCQSKRLRRYALREDALTLDGLLSKARALEASETQATGMEKALPLENVNWVQQDQGRHQKSRSTFPNPNKCRNCGSAWPHRDKPCPAKGQTCRKCGKLNHFARVCRARPGYSTASVPRQGQSSPQSHVRQVATQLHPDLTDSSDDEYLYTLGDSDSSKTPTVSVLVNNVPVQMMIDTGASANIMDESSFNKVNKTCAIQLNPSNKRIFAYGSDSQLKVRGQFTADIGTRAKHIQTTVHVLQGNHGSLLSYGTARDLGLVEVKVNPIQSQHASEEFIHQFPSLFHGIGKLKDVEVQLHIDKTIKPVAQAARRIPFHLRKQVSDELDNLERQGIIEKVEGPTPWVSPLVVIPKKKGGVRLCVDMRVPNKAIQRERHPSPTVDDLIHNLNGATVFSKLDLKAGYHQIPLAAKSRYITTFVTHKGLRRYTRLNFGTNSASEIFQHMISELLRDIPGAFNISDDVIVYGKTQDDHDKALRAVFQKFADVNLTLNKSKCDFNKSSLSFFGFVFSQDGISPDPDKVRGIHNMSLPKSVPEVRSFLGMATYCAKFIPSFSDISQPLRELTKKNVQFRWTQQHENSFKKIKQMLTSETTMAYFDPNKETELTTDASPVGLSAILSQRTPGQNDRHVVAYASRSLSDVERRYSQTEKEALAIVWAVERLHLYLYGKQFTLLTDCKPAHRRYDSQHEITPEITAPTHRRYDSQHEITPEITAPAHRRYLVRQKKTFCRYGQNIYEQ